MEALYINEPHYTKADTEELLKKNTLGLSKDMTNIKIMGVLIAGMELIGILLNKGQINSLSFLGIIGLCLAALIELYAFKYDRYIFFMTKLKGAKLRKVNNVEDKPPVFLFYENYADCTFMKHLEYSELTNFKEDDLHFVFYHKNTYFVLQKNAVTKGTPENFREFFLNKTGNAL